MKRIALLTIHNTTNYGSALQTFALYKTIEEMGYDIEILDYKCETIENKEFLRVSLKNPKSIYRHFKYGKKNTIKKDSFDRFVDGYAKLSKKYDLVNVKESNKDYDIFISGSDIVWGLNVTGNDFTYFLEFADDDKKKIAFASSAGIKWDENHIQKVKELLMKYNYIGVRESIVAGWIDELTGKRPDVVVDPTMLWSQEKWNEYIETDDVPKEKYILIYFMDPKMKLAEDAKKLGKKLGLKVYYINIGRDIPGIESVLPRSIGNFIGLIKNAEYVLTASYHALLFSIYFHREVYFYNRANFSRMESLSAWLGLESHNGMELHDFDDMQKIDYKVVDERIEIKRRESLDLLVKYLGDKDE